MTEAEQQKRPFADVRVCNCAWCNLLLIGPSEVDWYYSQRNQKYEIVAGRVDDRPYCAQCLPRIVPQALTDIQNPALEKTHV